ncbi:MAG: hypothetical protein IJ002_08950, partial [Clostridia bacterium]|nr:hypothetical protein [Clostridia bacterium]
MRQRKSVGFSEPEGFFVLPFFAGATKGGLAYAKENPLDFPNPRGSSSFPFLHGKTAPFLRVPFAGATKGGLACAKENPLDFPNPRGSSSFPFLHGKTAPF